ncbi:WD40/YVTN/BNR-like repeat-containing protein [Bacillus haynesii]|uniref:WD40/YVTN/BNR-like repeat-containing protein n=1 Tax=Bacillus haynesii TaxID=1925021 RepID=UPI00227F01B4|nr:exo-alpha-sialidase [Bacillus haynesii]MCY8091142.1 exo-alpha-sialidase [Bacillus haynesii]MCY8291812.1 exo-alpha-sialidase [Bacillus haynesii]MCY8409252.1 exo-alpha-sialidase [Bacillus haynesii]MCY8431470.1 exo-alpha-sialidase [Bacillus haynesii]MCY8625943.1 exo-alpha-sialidase [Bacillus haynesii]
MFHKGATAVASAKHSGYFVAIKREGIFHYSLEQGWKKLFQLKSKICSITYIGDYLFGVGERGTIIRSSDQGATWSISSFPTNATIWSITGRTDGFVCAHGKHCIYISEDFGVSWKIVKPFSGLSHPPVIRSLCLHEERLYIGTQIHEVHGGVWAYDYASESAFMIKKETGRMTASMIAFEGEWLVCAMGSKKGNHGAVDLVNIHTNDEIQIRQGLVEHEEFFLDVSEDNGIIYVTSAQDRDGFSRIYQLDFYERELKWFDTIKGHGFRVANQKENFFCAGLYECKFVRPYEQPAAAH